MEDFDFYSFVENKSDKNVFARFYDKYERTDQVNDHGLPVFKNNTWVEIRVRDSHDVVDTRATDEHKARFPEEYKFYLAKKEISKEGTPLTMFAFLNPAQIDCCEMRGIFTVEQLSELDKEKALSIGLVEEVLLAQKFIEMQKNNKDIKKYEKKIKELEDKVLTLTNQLNALRESK